jgi:hypothetical protein
MVIVLLILLGAYVALPAYILSLNDILISEHIPATLGIYLAALIGSLLLMIAPAKLVYLTMPIGFIALGASLLAAFDVIDISSTVVIVLLIVYGATTAIKIALTLSDFIMKQIERKYAEPPEKQRYLAFGAILSWQNGQSPIIFHWSDKGASLKELLFDAWGIAGKEEAMNTIAYLSAGEGHTAFVDAVYNAVIKKNRTEPLTKNDILAMPQLHNALKGTLKRMTSDGSLTLDDLSPEEREDLVEATLMRINQSMVDYAEMKRILTEKLTCTESEFEAIKTLAAWDYGRTAYIARTSAALEYVQADDVWQYIITAANNASAAYSSWRQYFIAYALGRAVGYGMSEAENLADEIDSILTLKNRQVMDIEFNVY